jgi:hypothetical protein
VSDTDNQKGFVPRAFRYSKWTAFERIPASVREALWTAVGMQSSGLACDVYEAAKAKGWTASTKQLAAAASIGSLDLDDFLDTEPTAPDDQAALVAIAHIREQDQMLVTHPRYNPDHPSTAIACAVPPLYARISDNPCPCGALSVKWRATVQLLERQRRFGFGVRPTGQARTGQDRTGQ